MTGEESAKPLIIKIKKKKNLYEVELEDGTIHYVTDEANYCLNLTVGDPWPDDERAMELLRKDLQKRGRWEALRIASGSIKTEHQIREKMKDRFEPSVVEDSLIFLKEYGYLNDGKVAEFVQEKELRKKKSRRAIDYKLKERGIGESVREEMLDRISEEDEFENALQIGRNKLSSLKNKTWEEKERKLFYTLQYRGFSSRTIRQVRDRCRQEEEETLED